jgi:hypothetical protein
LRHVVEAPVKRLLTALLALLAFGYLVTMYVAGALPERGHLVRFEAKGLLREPPEQVDAVVLTVVPQPPRRFTRSATGWQEDGKPVAAKTTEQLERAIKFMHNSEPVRAMSLDDLKGQKPEEFGLAPPKFTIRLQRQGVSLLEAGMGATNQDGLLNYVGVIGRSELFLLSHFVIEAWNQVSSAP